MDLKDFLDSKVVEYNKPGFIREDPISIPHEYSLRQDIEISGFYAAVFAWGQRKTILAKTRELMQRMDNSPHQFILHHSDQDLKKLLGFKHRTFNEEDLLYFTEVLKKLYTDHKSMEDLMSSFLNKESKNTEALLIGFHRYFFSQEDAPGRTRKHIATPARKSACKRLSMFLRWMVRKDEIGVDFGLWQKINTAILVCPLDLHVDRVARRLGLIKRKQSDWQTALELTENLKNLDPLDPVKYDFALYGLGIEERHGGF